MNIILCITQAHTQLALAICPIDGYLMQLFSGQEQLFVGIVTMENRCLHAHNVYSLLLKFLLMGTDIHKFTVTTISA